MSHVRLSHAAAFAAAIGLAARVPGPAAGADVKPRIPVGEFTARRLAKAPTVDGRIAPGEWDEALMTSGLVTPFGHRMHEAETTFAFGFDDERFYFLADCTRGNREWKLHKSARENDAYNFGDPSIEVWVSPPTPVAETYQSIINTFPAVMDIRFIPSRGYSAMGWTGRWKLGVTESDTRYAIEASIPIRDFGFDRVRDGDVWRLLLCRTSPGTKPRAQASWSITQGFSEIVQHPKVHLRDDAPLLQLHGAISIFTGTFDFPMAVAAPRGKPAKVNVTLRIQAGALPGAGDEVLRKSCSLKAGERKTFRLAGDVTARKRGVFTIAAATAGGEEFFRQSWPFEVNGFVHRKPVRPPQAPEPEPLALRVQYGPESNVLLAKADILDLPGRERAASAVLRVLDATSRKVIQEAPMPAFRNWHASGHLVLKKLRVPVLNAPAVDRAERYNATLPEENRRRAKKGQPPLKPRPVPAPRPLPVLVEVAVRDADGKTLRTASKPVDLLRYRFEWSDNDAGITDEVIPPWTPVTYEPPGTVGVWNRRMRVNGLGLLEAIDNGGASQVERMRLVAVAGGKAVEIQPSGPSLVRQVGNAVTLAGTGHGAGLRLSARTRFEFDGFALSELTIAPANGAGKAQVEGLYLEVVLPESEATHFCTTAGGWAAVHDETPKYWSSRQTGSGLLIGDFVPYVWLTNSDRALAWFADSDRGWITDDDRSHPTQEIVRAGGKVTLRVHFIERPAELRRPTTLTYGYQTFPSRPLPSGWRSVVCSSGRSRYLPSGRHTYFWFDSQADWAVLWPYYCSPYPWSMDKSRQAFSRFPPETTHRPMVGSIAHAVARYRDYAGHEFPGYVVDWGATPGDRSNGNCTQGRGPNDFRVWHYRQWVREAGFRGLYIDENYLSAETNSLTGGAYLRPDGRVQRGYSYLGLREYYKRMKVMFHRHRVPAPNLWMHVSSGAAYHAWLGDVFFEGENVEPTDLAQDYLAVLPAARMRAIGSARCAGGVMTMMCQSQRHRTVHEPKHTHQFVGWVMAHDILPEQVRFYEVLAQEGRLYEDDVEFVGYWRPDCPARTETPECLVSVHKTPHRALLWVVNTARRDQTAHVKLDFAKLGLKPGGTVALNAETGERLPLEGDALRAAVRKRDFAAVHLIERRRLKAGESFLATFDHNSNEADEAFGSGVFQAAGRGASRLVRVGGLRGAALAAGFAFSPHLSLADDEGSLSFHAKLPAEARGTILDAGRVRIEIKGGRPRQIVLTANLTPAKRDRRGRLVVGRDKAFVRTVAAGAPPAGWRRFRLDWKDAKLRLRIDGADAASCDFKGFGIGRPLGRDVTAVPPFVFERGAEACDEIRCRRDAE